MKKGDYYKKFFYILKWVKQFIIKETKNKYRELSEEEENIKTEYGRNRYKNTSEERKQRLKEYQKSYREANKTKKS